MPGRKERTGERGAVVDGDQESWRHWMIGKTGKYVAFDRRFVACDKSQRVLAVLQVGGAR